ncbi:inositol monophosphatase [Palleronia sediminis]|uniref:Inositol-1-monophosphatase n=1 Tax=Palleronia sediminis TaxID=2547833 RepID=A0A4R6AJA0_9RHOB|nr:inositol monophosphatase family protein [Palleronia sediminis]TDL84301.1 inositol monophosphatase [Palleronia sediminis]
MQGSANINIMVKAVRAAGRKLVRDFRELENLQVSPAGAADFAARAEVAAAAPLAETLRGERANYGWLARGAEEVAGTDPTRRWIVDPLDGAANYAHGLAHWAISVALEHKGEIVAAVVFDAAKNELFGAEKGAGAFLNDTRMRVSGRGRLIEGVFATGIPGGARADLPLVLKDLGRLAPASGGIRRMGAASLDLAYVAAGRFDGYWERRVRPWEVAAGMLLVREAGGLTAPIAGETVFDGETLVAANADMFDSLARLLRQQ